MVAVSLTVALRQPKDANAPFHKMITITPDAKTVTGDVAN
jgi:hypothetical protein